ncbi:MAG: NADP-dependent succinate-semialdehyde dehydrogenase [Gammaproteobacteria bacterium]|nr:NADP-dependent succinate-semialdehyde dehydrogenase [Gammaproteobacteria bacterium]
MKLDNQALYRQQCHINGCWLDAADGATIEVTNPADHSVVATIPRMGAQETREAIGHAARAQAEWRALLARERAAVVRRWADLMLENRDDLALMMTLEQGKPLVEARGEIAYAASFLEWFSEEAKRVYGETIPHHQHDKRLLVIKQPIGVCVAITPWNFPSAMITRKAGPAIAAGCAVVVKPATQTPLSALALCELAQQAGLPPGVFNVVTGDAREIGREMTSNPLVRHLSFTGSTETGRQLMKQCADSVIKVSLELGGNAPFIVFDDADLDAAVEGAMISKYRNGGQTCVCSNRIYVQDAVYDQFAARMARAVAGMRVGDGRGEGVVQGPLIDMAAVEKVEEHIADALDKGAELLRGGDRHELGGTYFQPTVLGKVTAQMKVAREETFGPLAPLFRFEDEDSVVEMANDTEFGLASYFYSGDPARIWRVAEALDYGMVGINTGLISTAEAPFGGVKQSGIGREGSRHGIEEYLEMKYLCIGGLG